MAESGHPHYQRNPQRKNLKRYLDAPNEVLRTKGAQEVKRRLEAGTYRVAPKIWREQGWVFYCPMCKTPRTLPSPPLPGGWKRVAQLTLTTLVLTMIAWPWMGPKGVVFFVPVWALYETVHRLWARAVVRCKSCGFDPFLYVSSRERAMEEFDAHWKRKFREKGVPWPEENDTELTVPPGPT